MVPGREDGLGPEYFPTQGSATDHREEAKETGGWEFGVPIIVGINGGRRLQGDQNINHKETKHGRTVYCNATNYGPLLAVCLEARG